MEVQDLSEGILAIGKEMVACSVRCRAASCSSSTPPRCLWLEPEDSSEQGVIVLGLNPAPAKADERRLYALQEMSYAVTVDYLREHHGSIPYFSRMRRLIRQMLGKTSILWTEVAKCELKTGHRNVPLSMQGICASRYLKREVELVPKTWPVVAAGTDAYRVAALLFSDRPVLGVPHPTGTFGRRFSGLLEADHAWAKQQFERVITNGGAVWLSKGKINLAAIELDEVGIE